MNNKDIKGNFFLRDYINRILVSGKDPEYFVGQERLMEKTKGFFQWPGVIFVLNLFTGKYEYLSNTFPLVTQCHYNALLEGGIEYFYSKMMKLEDLKIVDGFFDYWFNFISSIEQSEIEKYWFTSNFRVYTEDKKMMHILQHIIINEVDSRGFPKLITGICLDINNFKNSSTIINRISIYHPDSGLNPISEKIFHPNPETKLTKREIEICKLICEE